MNKELVDHLLYQSGLTAQGALDDYDQAQVYKFAELLVGETVDVLRNQWYALNNTVTPPDEPARYTHMRVGSKTQTVHLINTINSHYGLEQVL